MSISIIGVDCATQAKNVGLGWGRYEAGLTTIKAVVHCRDHAAIINQIVGWIASAPVTLLALDAPLGWPRSLGFELHSHRAGGVLGTEPNHIFRRETDRFIKRKIGKQPLDVGADRIARTAHAALTLLANLRERTGTDIPLAWHSTLPGSAAAIEVYPAATLLAHGLKTTGYKGSGGERIRWGLLEQLQTKIDYQVDLTSLATNDDAFDATICVLAGADFLEGTVYPPEDLELAEVEGWIWVRSGEEIVRQR